MKANKFNIGDDVVITSVPDNKIYKVVSRTNNVYNLNNGKFYLGSELARPTKFDLEVGDRFYFFKNMKKYDLINVGYKGFVTGFMNGEIASDGLLFLTAELKPIITLRAVLGNEVEVNNNGGW